MAPRDAKSYHSELRPVWCPGCGDYGVLAALCQALAALAIPQERLVVVSGIGCSSRMPGYIRGYGFHGIHGRAIPLATGIALARPDLTVLVTMGDGDAYGIGGNHLLHAARRNLDLTCIIMNNQVYGMTKGQVSPTTPRGDRTSTTPYGSPEPPLHPLLLALAAGATFVARGASWEATRLAAMIAEGIRHRGCAVIDVLAPCVVFRPEDRASWKQHILPDEAEPPSTDRLDVMRRVLADDGLRLGIFFQIAQPTYWDAWQAIAEAATARPSGTMGLSAIVAGLPRSLLSPRFHEREQERAQGEAGAGVRPSTGSPGD
ncbi:thiamine pyrophosphate-dependent enzyme [Nitrospira sp. Kam-Ns4a]